MPIFDVRIPVTGNVTMEIYCADAERAALYARDHLPDALSVLSYLFTLDEVSGEYAVTEKLQDS